MSEMRADRPYQLSRFTDLDNHEGGTIDGN